MAWVSVTGGPYGDSDGSQCVTPDSMSPCGVAA
ncbi:Uncharacterised protein [Mycobacterium tuberculosis]|nr:Uncharacterised protein [Mycobacterium tuberculosis]